MMGALLLALVLGATPSTVGGDVTLDRRDGTMRLRVQAAVDGSLEKPWRAFFERLVQRFDRNGDGTLDDAEAARLFLLPVDGGQAVAIDFASAESDRDGRLSVDEVCDWYRAAGFGPVAVLQIPKALERSAVSEALAQSLDRDGDSILSVEEVDLAIGLLKRFDDDEDEVLGADELLCRSSDDAAPVAPQPVTMSLQDPTGEADAIVELSRSDATPSVHFIAPGADATANLIVIDDAKLQLEPSPSPPDAFASAKRFYLSQFAAKARDAGGVSHRDLEADRSLRAVSQMATFADRDGDEMLTTEELSSFLDLIEAGASCRTVVTIRDLGANLFDRLDENADGALDFAELRRASKGGTIDLARLPHRYVLTVGVDAPSNSFGPAPLPNAPKRQTSTATSERSGPKWFLSMDGTGDGVVSQTEFRGTPERFAAFDLDGDGRIDREEAEQAGGPR